MPPLPADGIDRKGRPIPPPCVVGTIDNTVPPSISPSGAQPRGTFFATSTGSWAPCQTTVDYYEYQWKRNGNPIGGATGSGYAASGSDLGSAIRSSVRACSLEYGCSAFVDSSDSATIVNRAPLTPYENISPDGITTTNASGPFQAKYSDPDGDSGSLTARIYTSGGALTQTKGQSGLVSGATASIYLDSGLAPGDYYWTATATDDLGDSSAASDQSPFTILASPPVPMLESPVGTVASPSLVTSVTPVLRAKLPNQGTPVGVQFRVTSDSGCAASPVDSSLLGTVLNAQNEHAATWQVSATLVDNAVYYWCARSRTLLVTDDSGWSPWSAVRAFRVKLPTLGVRSYWPIWQRGPLAVNQATGNLVVSLPGPSYPTGIGPLETTVTYNSLDTRGGSNGLFSLGQGWTLGTVGAVPAKLIDHAKVTVPDEQYDAIERVSADGSSDYYAHVGSSNAYQSQPGDASRVVRNADNTWSLSDPDGSFYTFSATENAADKSYPLTGAEVSVGSSGQAVYSVTTDGSGRVTAIAAKQGTTALATLTFDWGCATKGGGGLLCVIGPDGRYWRYVGDGAGGTSGRLRQVSLVSADGTVTRPLAAVSYGATSGLVEGVQNANDLSPTDANLSAQYRSTHKLQVAYASGKVASVIDGPIRDREGASPTDLNPRWDFAYTCSGSNPLQLPAPAVSHPGPSWPSSAAGCSELKPPNQQPSGARRLRVWYDALRHPLKRADVVDDVNGTYTLSLYNAANQLLWTEDETGAPTDYAYDLVDGTLLSATGPDPDGANPTLGRVASSYRYDESAVGSATTAGPALNGLRAAYYADQTLAGRPAVVQNDPKIDATWSSAPVTGMPADDFSVRWSGNLVVAAGQAGTWAFSTVAAGGTRVVLDGVELVNKWGAQTTGTPICSPPVELSEGKHVLVVEYKDTGSGTAEVHLRAAKSATCSAGDPVIPDASNNLSFLPAWLNQTSVVSPKNTDGGAARVSFTHFAQPWTRNPDYALAQVAGTNHVTSYDYDPYGRLVTIWMPKANAARTVDAGGNLSATPAPDTNYRTLFAYYTPTETAAIDVACGSSSALPQKGLPKSIQHAGMTAAVTVYDSGGRPLSVKNAKGAVCSTYDNEGRLTQEAAKTGAASVTTTYAYEPTGLLARASDPSGAVVTERNEAEAPIKLTDSFGAVEKHMYDIEGNTTQRQVLMPGGSPTYTSTYNYNEGNQLISQTDPAGRTYALFHDTRGNPVGANYPTSNATFGFRTVGSAGWLENTFNRHGALTTPTGKIAGTAPASAPADASPLADYTYSSYQNGQRKSEQRTVGAGSAQTTSYGYDQIGRLETLTNPDGSTRRICFDRDSNRTEVQAAASGSPPACGTAGPLQAMTYSVASTSGLDQLTSISQQGQATRSFAYNGDGDVIARGPDTLTWDVRGRLTGGTFSAQTLIYQFDAAGYRRQRTTQVNYPGRIFADIPFNYWRLGETSGAAAYDGVGANGVTFQGGYTRNVTGALGGSGDTDKAATLNGSTGYARAAAPVALGSGEYTVELWFKTSLATADQVLYFSGAAQAVCAIGKVLLRTTSTGKLRYFIEDGSSGNNAWIETAASIADGGWHHAVATRTGTGANTTITLYLDGALINSFTASQYPIGSVDPASNHVTQLGSFYPCNSGVGYAYLNGSLDEVAVYKRALSGAEAAAHYQRGTQAPLFVTMRFLLGGLVETDTAGVISRFDVDSPLGDLAQYGAAPTSGQTNVSFLYYNGHGDLAATARSSGGLTGSYAYAPFGQPGELTPWPTGTTSERFTGAWDKKLDPASFLIEMGARPYDPLLGRFLSVDPIVGGSLNTYDYAGQDPINNYDVDGRAMCEGSAEAPCGAASGAATSIGAATGTAGAVARVTVIGRFPGYVDTARALGANYFSIPLRVWRKMTPMQQWAANRRFLDRAIRRGDTVIISSPLKEIPKGSWTRREINYLLSRGYRLSPDRRTLLPPG